MRYAALELPVASWKADLISIRRLLNTVDAMIPIDDFPVPRIPTKTIEASSSKLLDAVTLKSDSPVIGRVLSDGVPSKS